MEEPIVAIATGNINSALGIIRLSGEGIREEVNKILNKPILEKHDHKVVFRRILIEGKEYDHGLVTYFKSPHSYTGEDSIEISLHGNIINLKRIVEAILKKTRCRLAEPGEFTKRAFMNGKIDLTQAEAIAELIASQSERALDISLRHLEGDVKSFLSNVRKKLIKTMSYIEIELDFSEEELEFVDRTELKDQIQDIINELQKAYQSFKLGTMLQEGVRISIMGKPNSGKSSLLNAILGRERAIVSDIPGTTRDYLEERVTIEGILFHFVDTAGIRFSKDSIEEKGIRYSKELMEKVDMIIVLLDAVAGFTKEDQTVIEIVNRFPKERIIYAINKIDRAKGDSLRKILKEMKIENSNIIEISALEYRNVPELLDLIKQKIISQAETFQESLIITSVRQAHLIQKTIEELNNVIEAIRQNMSSEFLSFEMRNAMDTIGEITGEIVSDDILNNIFSSFCIGK